VRRILALGLLWLALATPARAGVGLFVGIDDDSLKWNPRPAMELALMRDLGVSAIRVTVPWAPGETSLTGADRAMLDRVVGAAWGLRVVVALYGTAADAPRDDAARTAYCATAADLLRRYPSVADVVVWNEPNSARFWQPQAGPDGASLVPAAYEALLARCWDALHAVEPDANVIAASAPRRLNVTSIAPSDWYRELGAAYRASGRERPIFDTVGHNAYPDNSAQRVWARHPGGEISEGDYAKLMTVLQRAFSGSAQPPPGSGGVTIWYLEQGFQSTIAPAKRGSYTGQENDRFALPPSAGLIPEGVRGPAPDQATQLGDAVRLAYCQPAVGAVFNFELADETNLGGWQSGVLWADGTPKPSYEAFRGAVAEARENAVDCARFPEAARSAPTPGEVKFTAPPGGSKTKP